MYVFTWNTNSIKNINIIIIAFFILFKFFNFSKLNIRLENLSIVWNAKILIIASFIFDKIIINNYI